MNKHGNAYLLFLTALLLGGCGANQNNAPAAAAQHSIQAMRSATAMAIEATKLPAAQRPPLLEQARKQLKDQEKDYMRLQALAAQRARWASLMQQAAEEAQSRLLHSSLEQARLETLLAKQRRITAQAAEQARLRHRIAQDAIRQSVRTNTLLAQVRASRQLALASIDRLGFSPAATQPMARVAHAKPIPSPARKLSATPARLTKKPAMRVSAFDNNTGDAMRGMRLARKCRLCHSFEPGTPGPHGPSLYGVLDEPAGKQPRFHYSHALTKAAFIWREEALEAYLCHSGRAIKTLTGNHHATTKMPPQHICGQDAKDVIAYLRTLKAQAARTHSSSQAKPAS
ncbi:MAG: hypothetical protein D6678_06585 [Zetaproteobacteria bacterium]|nr:MAG: hypothetical protein D6678_06585 [Zetaproteobacteria bacterium]